MTLLLNGTNGVSDVDGSASTPAIRGTDTNTGIFFPAADTIAFAEGGAEVARFDSDGDLGIGTSNPAAKLHVRASSTGSTANGIMLDAGAQQHSWYLTDNTTSTFSIGSSAGVFTWANSGGERMRLDSSGNFLVNATATTGNLEKMTLQYPANTNNGIFIKNTFAGTGVNIGFVNSSNTTVGNIQSSTTVTSYVTTSDYRLKENVAPMTGALATVQALKPVTYKWKADGSDGQGFIAHELQAVVPDAATGEKDAVDADGNPVYQGIDTSFLVATLTAAIQEQQAIITDLKSRIEALEQA